ncbi:NADPH-dependent FMN reductase [Actinomyces sp. zg296]|uniref:NADPH-dependent FMN reductase n=1 Tax=Actinomyces sp. zg296 TaxID=2609289 RepID=UPI00135684FB|nr:NAD(P)H-dependent oxidoreductase [Actinomyces sp. zg296]
MTIRIAVVHGSIRPASAGAAVADWVAAQSSLVDGVEAEVLRLADFKLPLFAEELPPAIAMPQHPAGVAWNERLGSYDAVIFVTPEYDHSIPGALKNAIDYLAPSVLESKAIGVVGYSYQLGLRAIEHLRQVLASFNSFVVGPHVALHIATDWTDGEFAPAAFHEGEVPAMVRAIVAATN